eukprot:48225_1
MNVYGVNNEWQCLACTLLNKTEDINCVLCGTIRSMPMKNKHEYGSIIYRIEPFTMHEMQEINQSYTKHDKHPIILYPNNDINYKRDKSSDTPLLSSSQYNKEYLTKIISPYDRTFCYGVVVQFHNTLLNYYKKIEILPIFADFKHIMDKQFHLLQTQYIARGHDIIIPSPHSQEMNKDTQCIFHTLGTHPNGLPTSYVAYIQKKINELHAKAIIYPKEITIDMEHDREDIYTYDEEEEKEIDLNTIQYSKHDPIEVFDKHKNVWIRGTFVGEYSDGDHVLYFVEIPEVLESKIVSIEPTLVRYLQETDDCEFDDGKEDEKTAEIITKTDDNDGKYWDNVNDFVFKEYIIDVVEAMPHLLTNHSLFLEKMSVLGITSDKSKNRALTFINEIQKERQLNEDKKDKEKEPQYIMKSVITNKAIYVHITQPKHSVVKCRYYCKQKQSAKDGIELSCKHWICCTCFEKYIKKCVHRHKLPKCKKCEQIFSIKDIERHVVKDSTKQNIIAIMQHTEEDSCSSSDAHDTESDSDSDSSTDSDDIDTDSSLDYEDKIAQKWNKNVDKPQDVISKPRQGTKRKNNRKKGIFYCNSSKCDGYVEIKSKRKRLNKKSFKCLKCKAKNCIDCNVIHKAIKDKKIRKLKCSEYQFLYQNKFLHRWDKLDMKSSCNVMKQLKRNSKMKKLYKVKRNSTEWKEVISHMQTVNQFHVTRIDRVQNSRLYREYYKHCKRMILKREISVNEMSVWHGTRTTDPSMVWKNSGFDVRFANVGGCIWFAVQNNYSMGGYQFRTQNGQNQVFLAYVAGGDYESVKFIRNGQILNVYKNQSMYPAYLLTYQGSV